MKRLFQLFSSVAIIILSALQPSGAAAQSSGSAHISATIVIPTVLTKQSDLVFDNVSIRRHSNGKSHARITKNAKEEVQSTMMGASFSISGYPDYAYDVTIDRSVIVSADNHRLTVGMESCSASGTNTLSKNGTDTINIEGTMALASAGAHASNTEIPNGLTVTVNNY